MINSNWDSIFIITKVIIYRLSIAVPIKGDKAIYIIVSWDQ